MVDNIGNMSEDNGKNASDKTVENEFAALEQQEKQAQENNKNVFVGVDGEGYFVFKAHTSLHPWMIIGGLTDAISQYRGMILRKQKEVEEQRKKLMGGSRRFFNILKPHG